MKKSKVSIVVAIYNSEKFLPKLIESILNQTYNNLEIILVNDGSPDNSGAICDEYAMKDNRIKVIHKKNGGTCDARNRGIIEATGDYLTIIDGDDWLSDDYVEYLVNLIENNDADMSMTDVIFTTRDQEQISYDKIEVVSGEEAALRIIYPGIAIGPWNKLYKMSIIKEHNISFNVPWSGEGLYFASLLAQYSRKVAIGHKKIYNYRLNNTGSGLTNYKLIIGTNALDNIIYIGKNLIIKSKRMEKAVRWHTWKNYNYVLKLIIATNSIQENKKLYIQCKKNIKKMMFQVAVYSEISIKERIKVFVMSIFPIYFAKRSIRIEQKALKKDKME